MTVKNAIRLRLPGQHILRVRPGRILYYTFMLLIVAFTMLPIVYALSTAFKPLDELYLFPPTFFVQKPTIKNFSNLLYALSGAEVPFLRNVFNSLFVAVAAVGGTTLVSTLGAYALAKHRVPFGKLFFNIIIAALLFSTHVTQTSVYMVSNAMGLMNTYWALILPKIAVAYNLFLMKQFAESIPDSLLEAARIDGAREITIFGRIVLPILRPAIATLVVLTFVSCWNDYFTPLVFTTSQAMKTLPLALQTIGQNGAIARAGAMSAGTFVMIVPVVVLYLIMQKQVIQTMVHSGIK